MPDPTPTAANSLSLPRDSAPWLDGKHTVFGKVVEGIETVDKIENVATDKAKNDHPVENVTIESVTIAD